VFLFAAGRAAKMILSSAYRLFILLIFCVVSSAAAQAADPISLWPHGAPGGPGAIGQEGDMTTPKDGLFGGKPVARIGNVTDPTLTFYPAAEEKNTRTLIVVCPGGGYEILAMDLEGTEICQWLNSIGVNAALLKYRVPARNGWERHTAPLQDVQRAVGLARCHAADWKVDPKRIGIIGFRREATLPRWRARALSNAAMTRRTKRTELVAVLTSPC
jgi:acetyl esterase/lipase